MGNGILDIMELKLPQQYIIFAMKALKKALDKVNNIATIQIH